MIEIEKNIIERIRVVRPEFRGHDYIDVRVYIQKDDDWIPTKKGVTILLDKMDAVVEAIRSEMEKHHELD